jgi:hypothetical protein
MISKTSGGIKIEDEIHFSTSTITEKYIHAISSNKILK